MSVELARWAVTRKHWRWLEGMKSVGGVRITFVAIGHDPKNPGEYDLGCDGGYLSSAHTLPDLEDAATLGCLLALVREARQEPWYYPTAQVYGGQVLWLVERPVSERQTLHESEASALVAALEAAP